MSRSRGTAATSRDGRVVLTRPLYGDDASGCEAFWRRLDAAANIRATLSDDGMAEPAEDSHVQERVTASVEIAKIAELDLNPVFVRQRVVVADVRVRFEP